MDRRARRLQVARVARSPAGLAPGDDDDRPFDATFMLVVVFDEGLPRAGPAFGGTGTYEA